MLREEGVVVAVEGDYALVVSQRKSGCGSCQGEASCSTLSGGLGNKAARIRARNPLHAEVGERVVLEMTEAHLLRASFLVYGLPVIALVLGGLLSRSLALSLGVGDSESAGALGGLLALVASFYGLYRYNQHLRDDDTKNPVIARVIIESATGGHACSS
ncbi:MAG: SoxR reducing system RseC family protein [Magnetococcales bacterium]|nr:SoxR reducing system RseC family protein [Magnetococcales bacterium]MBF0583994.1 SoxR reducing system RseC family protein [Magnetococcales bacterium]